MFSHVFIHIFYAIFHACNFDIIIRISWKFHQNVELRNWEWYTCTLFGGRFLLIWEFGRGRYSVPNQANENPWLDLWLLYPLVPNSVTTTFGFFADRSSRNNSENGKTLVIYLTVLWFIKVKHVLLFFENCQMYLPLRVSKLFIISN